MPPSQLIPVNQGGSCNNAQPPAGLDLAHQAHLHFQIYITFASRWLRQSISAAFCTRNAQLLRASSSTEQRGLFSRRNTKRRGLKHAVGQTPTYLNSSETKRLRRHTHWLMQLYTPRIPPIIRTLRRDDWTPRIWW
jgi:hypothetical protein